ncbi:MAG: iron-containing alcohol dehydrogenase, partial [Gammaproteobacteria bacterium]|nr:iron-containing alcohol dehydrogenase [Gammaproteobacteria bacterium]
FKKHQINYQHCTVHGEPSPQMVDDYVAEFSRKDIDVVIAIGGGSALDAAKAIAGLLKIKRSVMDYLEGVGPELKYEGPAVPFIAVPTTAGTGSEATKNAVLSVQGLDGFKKSFRDDQLVAEYAIIDPELLKTCPPELIAANGMDALTQLMESYVSLKANPMTDALAISGLNAARDGLIEWYDQGGKAKAAREKMAYAALISGITLAQTGLGSVHGLAAPLGAFYPVPHGVACGTLMATATEMNIQAMLEREPKNTALGKYVHLADVLCKKKHPSRESAWEAMIICLTEWTERMQLPVLSTFGVSKAGLDNIVENSRGSSMRTNPIVLTNSEIRLILEQRLS